MSIAVAIAVHLFDLGIPPLPPPLSFSHPFNGAYKWACISTLSLPSCSIEASRLPSIRAHAPKDPTTG